MELLVKILGKLTMLVMLPALFLFEFLMPILFNDALSDIIYKHTSNRQPMSLEMFYVIISLLMWIQIVGYLGN